MSDEISDERIERVARAIANIYTGKPPWQAYAVDARAALSADADYLKSAKAKEMSHHDPLPHLPSTPEPMSFWKHKQNGDTYLVLALAYNEADLAPVVVYMRAGDTDLGKLSPVWVRPRWQFVERFEPTNEQVTLK